MNFHAEPVDINSHGHDVTQIGQMITDGTRKGRSLSMTLPGLVTGTAFEGFRDAWLGQGEKIGINLDDSGAGTTNAGDDHEINEQATTRGYEAIHPK